MFPLHIDLLALARSGDESAFMEKVGALIGLTITDECNYCRYKCAEGPIHQFDRRFMALLQDVRVKPEWLDEYIVTMCPHVLPSWEILRSTGYERHEGVQCDFTPKLLCLALMQQLASGNDSMARVMRTLRRCLPDAEFPGDRQKD